MRRRVVFWGRSLRRDGHLVEVADGSQRGIDAFRAIAQLVGAIAALGAARVLFKKSSAAAPTEARLPLAPPGRRNTEP
jgi:hypothetical protein